MTMVGCMEEFRFIILKASVSLFLENFLLSETMTGLFQIARKFLHMPSTGKSDLIFDRQSCSFCDIRLG